MTLFDRLIQVKTGVKYRIQYDEIVPPTMDARPGSRMEKTRELLAWSNSHRLAALLAVLLPVCGMIGAWRITAGDGDLLHLAMFLDFLFSTWMLATYAVIAALLVASMVILRFGHRITGEGTDLARTLRRQSLVWLTAYLVFAGSTMAIGWLFAVELEASMMRDRLEQQRAIAGLKAQQVDKWIAERLLDEELLATALSGPAFEKVQRDGAEARQSILTLTEFLANYPERVAVSLFLADGKVLAHLGHGAGPDPQVASAVEKLAAAHGTSTIIDVYRTAEAVPRVHMAIIVAVLARGRDRVEGYLATTLDPFRVLFKDVAVWPGPSPSSEVVVVRRDGPDVVFVTPPRLMTTVPDPLQFRERIDGSALPAARALVEGDGVRLGPDYRGIEVVTASQHVDRLPWTVVAKTDRAEIMVPIHAKQERVALAVAVTLVITAGMVLFMARGQRASTISYSSHVEAGRRAATQRYAFLVQMAPDVVLTLDMDGRIIEANEAAVRAYGYSMNELVGRTVKELRTPDELVRLEQQWAGGQAPDGVLFETVHRRKDGTIFPVEVSGRTIEVEGRPLRQAFVRDITIRKGLQRDVLRLARVQRAMQAGTRILLRAENELDLFQAMCDAIVEVGGYRLAAVAIANDDERRSISFVATSGPSDGYLEGADGTWGPGPNGRGTTGTAIRMGTIQVNKDFATNPEVAACRDAALARGLRSSVALPLRSVGKVFGALAIHAGEPNAFGPEELELLGTLADDISYGLDSLRERQRNRLLERQIGQAARLQAVTQAMMGILARARSAAELYQEACAVMVDVGGFRLAAVGERQKDSGHKIAFLAVHGADEGYLARAAATWDERPDTREPLGGALRTGDIQVIANENGSDSDPATAAWRVDAEKHGLKSAIVLPLKHRGRTFAALALYAERPDPFERNVIDALVTIARNLSDRAVVMSAETGA